MIFTLQPYIRNNFRSRQFKVYNKKDNWGNYCTNHIIYLAEISYKTSYKKICKGESLIHIKHLIPQVYLNSNQPHQNFISKNRGDEYFIICAHYIQSKGYSLLFLHPWWTHNRLLVLTLCAFPLNNSSYWHRTKQ